MQPNADILKSNIQYIAKQLGFSDCRIAAAKIATHADDYLQWVEDGCAGDMAWLERNQHRRVDPREVLPGAKSIVTLALNYYPGDQPAEHDFKIARYSWNEDYHVIIDEKLRDLNLAMEEMGGQQRYYVDTGPVLERDFATDAGLGWNGKSTVQIHRKFGTWFFLCELITTLDLTPDSPFGDHCGKCTRCMDNCPTGAITGPHRVDARKCISYLTIEHLGSIPEDLRPLMGNRIYGCDVCLEVCPWNRFAQISQHTQLHAKQEIFQHSLRDLVQIDEDDFRRIFAKSPIKRIKHPRFIRNVCIALGNTGTEADIDLLRPLAQGDNELVSEHATWAIEHIKKRTQAKA
ncbi:epoxyqueuosine reductase [Rubritalea halochordaticola]|uniref:Epoxyqueuosine reductase n=1 Tax=Rubritalea halochordaticola TaxID=714537 RepID=A0ABP9V819_9BACT